MGLKKTILGFLVCASFIACQKQNQTQQTIGSKGQPVTMIPLKDFFKNSDKSSYEISPGGESFAFMAPYENRMNIHVQKAGSKDTVLATKETDRDIAGYFWVTDNRLLYLKDSGGDENFSLYGVDKDGSNQKTLTKDGAKIQLIDDLIDIPDYVIIGSNERNPQIFDAYRLNVLTGEQTMIAENPGNISGWMTDHKGALRIAIATDGVNQTILYRDDEKKAFKPVLTTNFKESFSPQFFDFDNGTVVYGASNIGRDKSAIVKFDLSTGKEMEELFNDANNDVESLSFSRKRKVLTAAHWYAEKAKRHFFDKESKEAYEYLEAQLPGLEIAVTSANKNEDKFIVRTYSDKSRGQYYFFDKEKKTLEKIADVSPWINDAKMADMKPITYKSRDGLTIHGYLTLPKGRDAKNLPVVVNPHGGPWARDRWGFNPEVQFLANRGYAVLQMNFRGSTSYGRKFWEASFKEWGQKMQDDVTDGVKWLIDQGIADPKKVAIYGASYGGYATLAGLSFTPDLYACGVDYVGVSNLFTFMETIPPYWKQYLEMLHEMVGDPSDATDKKMLSDYSPSIQADKITAPLFIAQGANDPRVKKSESDQMVSAMKERGVNVEYMVKDDEGHGFHNEENRFEFYEAMEKFLQSHMQ